MRQRTICEDQVCVLCSSAGVGPGQYVGRATAGLFGAIGTVGTLIWTLRTSVALQREVSADKRREQADRELSPDEEETLYRTTGWPPERSPMAARGAGPIPQLTTR